MKKILFAFYPLFVKYNHGVALLSQLCKNKGIDVSLHLLDAMGEFRECVKNGGYDYVAFSAVTPHDYEKCVPFIEEAKRLGATVMLGGVYARRGLPIDAPVDYLCRGEGEALPEFILNGDDRLFREKMVCEDIASLPLPDYELFKNIPFERGVPFLKGKKVLPYYSSRGCAHRCSFCEVQGQLGGLRFKNKTGNDLAFLADKYKPDVFFIGDELLPYYNPEWRASWGDFKHPFIAYIRADISNSQLEWLHERGMMGCAFGVESGDERYRNEVLMKGLSDADLFRTVAKLNELQISYVPYFMTDTPGETFAIKAKTSKVAERIGGYPLMFKYESLYKARCA